MVSTGRFLSPMLAFSLSLRIVRSVIPITPVRLAHHAAEGRANRAPRGRGKRLGAKKASGEFVVPGNIIFRQRGTKWHPGENVDVGRDHTIFATEKGWVRYYRDPERHPKRKYIGVALSQDRQLPTPRDEARPRRLNMVSVPYEAEKRQGLKKQTPVGVLPDGRVLPMLSNYMFHELNREIGRVGEREGIQVREFKKNDRWLAWRTRAQRSSENKGKRISDRELKRQKAEKKRAGKEKARQIQLARMAAKEKAALA